MNRKLLVLLCTVFLSGQVAADITSVARDGHRLKVGDKQQRSHDKAEPRSPNATGAQALADLSGLEYFINTDITFATSSSASGAASEASYQVAVSATTVMNGVTSSTLNDAFDGYNALCVSTDGATGPCDSTGGGLRGVGTVTMYNENGVASLDASCSNRQVILPVQTISGIAVQRKVFVPSNDEFIRWTNIFTNTSGAPITMQMITSNNLGSDAGTTIVTSSSGDAVVSTADLWATSFQSFSGTTSSDVRLGHVFGGPGASVGLSGVNFVNGDDNPFWRYTLTLQPGQTQIVVNYGTGQPSRADAAAKAAELTALAGNAAACMTANELAQVVNYAAAGQTNQAVPLADQRILMAVAAMLMGLGLIALRRHNS